MKTCIVCGSGPVLKKLCGSDECLKKYNSGKQQRYRERTARKKRNMLALQIEPEMMKITSPPVRYFGGKWRISSWIMEQFPPHMTYVEPFCGGASTLFRKQPSKIEVINDLNGDIVAFFDCLRSRPAELVSALQLTPYHRLEHRLAHEPVPDDYPDRQLEVARRFYIRSRQSFGTGEGEYNTGWRFQPDEKRGTSCIDEWNNLDHLYAAARRLKSVQIESDDAIRCIKRFDRLQTLFYVDPPYVFSTRYSNVSSYAHEMSDQQHRVLADVLHGVQGMVLISGYQCELYDELYGDWRCISKDTRTNDNHDATEYLWISPNADDVNRLPLFSAGINNG